MQPAFPDGPPATDHAHHAMRPQPEAFAWERALGDSDSGVVSHREPGCRSSYTRSASDRRCHAVWTWASVKRRSFR